MFFNSTVHSKIRDVKMNGECLIIQLHYVFSMQVNLSAGCYFPWKLWIVLAQLYRRCNTDFCKILQGTLKSRCKRVYLPAVSSSINDCWENNEPYLKLKFTPVPGINQATSPKSVYISPLLLIFKSH